MTIKLQNIFNRILNKDAAQDSSDAHRPTSIISPMFTGSYLQSIGLKSMWSLWGLVAVSFAAFFIAQVRGLAASDVQLFVFPIVVFILWFSPAIRAFSCVKIFLVIAFVLWLASVLHIRGYMSSILPGANITIAKLEGDNEGLFRGELLRDIKRKNRERSLSASVGSIYTDFSTLAEARHWLEVTRQSAVVFFGDKEWVRLLISDKQLRALVPEKMSFSKTSDDMNAWIVEQAQMLGINLNSEVLMVRPEGVSFPLLISFNVDFLTLPLKPLGLATQYLSFLTQGLVDNSGELNAINELSLSLRRSWFMSAASIYGYWKSNGALGLAWFLVGNFDLYRGLLIQEQQGDLSCAATAYGAAANKAWARSDPAVVAGILNNYAIVSFLSLDQDRNYQGIEKSLFTALTTFNLDGTSPRGAKIALLNLMILRKAGIL